MAFFENPEVPEDILIPFRENGKYGYCTYNGVKKYPTKLTQILDKPVLGSRTLKVYLLVEGEKVGLLGPGWKLKARNQTIFKQGNDDWFVYNKKGKAGWLNVNDGTFLLPQKYDDLYRLHDYLVLARKGSRYGLFSRSDRESKLVNAIIPIEADSIWMTYRPTPQIFCRYGGRLEVFNYDYGEKKITATAALKGVPESAQRYHSPLWARKNILDELQEEDYGEPAMEVGGDFGSSRRNTAPITSFQDSTFKARVGEYVFSAAGKAAVSKAIDQFPKSYDRQVAGIDFLKTGAVNDSISLLYIPLKGKQAVRYFHRPDYKLVDVKKSPILYFDDGDNVDVMIVGYDSKLYTRFSFPSKAEILPFETSFHRAAYIRLEGEDYLLIYNHNFRYPDYFGRFKFPAAVKSVRWNAAPIHSYFKVQLAGETKERLLMSFARKMVLSAPFLEEAKRYQSIHDSWYVGEEDQRKERSVHYLAELGEKGLILRCFRPDGSEIRPR